MGDSKKAEKDLTDGLNELDAMEGFELFGGDDEEEYDYDDYDDDYDDYDYDDYEGMGNKKEKEKVSEEDLMAEIDKMSKELESEEGFGNMFNLDFSKNCMILIVIVLILILCKEDIMKMSFFKKLFK